MRHESRAHGPRKQRVALAVSGWYMRQGPRFADASPRRLRTLRFRVCTTDPEKAADVRRLGNYLDEPRIKLPTRVRCQFFHHHVKAKRLTVRAVGGHGVDRVGNHDNPSTDGNCRPYQSVRIPRSVKILVMVSNGVQDGALEFRNVPYQLGASHYMSLHDHALFRR